MTDARKIQKSDKSVRREERVDQASDQSFPASDPPATSPMTTGAPKRSDPPRRPASRVEPERKD